ncbi:beta-mannosidase [Chryseotalea sanaruensis]|uniref:Beta-mannosidase B n=1 Tax=Chryseotalea sanaruensis TaxID=2482724 RepID=A0A401U9N3_9BACT|nr:glycoside hydrolase family 2 protein [Chryseotalea sanaruensis]GCC51590.1 beta-mannosidase [Chryseotalea sanaruensis]
MRHILILLCYLPTISAFCQVEKVSIDQQWKFRQTGKQEWLPATVPGTVHTDLLANKKIEDPFFGTNEMALQWIDTLSWEYQTAFIYTFNKKHKKVYLNFEGLDTYATIYLNDSPIGNTDNMFRTWKFDVTKNIKAGKNTIRIIFQPASSIGKAEVKKLNYTLPGDEKVFTRKAAYHYGWDWGPRFVTCGIWKPVSLEIESDHPIIDHHQFLIQELTEKEAKAFLKSAVRISEPSTIKISVFDKVNNTLLGISTHAVSKDSIVQTNIIISNPKLWWCNGYGEPNLYTLKIVIENLPTKTRQDQEMRVGLRTITLVQERDSLGKSFYFKLNGKPIFSKGANYIPPDNFLPRIKKGKYKEIVERAKAANMNMLRVWGGGVYADDAFYEACDEAGILVWQDFMFACAMYPGDDHFIDNVRQEATEQVIRLRNHASLALWCGNNEISEGWYNWGWQKQLGYSKNDSSKIWNDYLKLFEKVLPEVVNQYDQPAVYWPSSPKYGWGRKQSLLEGDIHYWGVWWGMQPFSVYDEKIGRFMSEYGFQGMPSQEVYTNITNEKNINLQSPVVKHHQKHPTGFETIDHYLRESYKAPEEFTDYGYVSQLVQADGMKIAIEAHRRNQPYCMGSLYWQLNDCWPVTSWSSIDHLNIPKASHYAITRAFSSNITSILKEEHYYKVYLITDHSEALSLTISLLKLNGEKIWEETSKIKSEPLFAKVVYQKDSVSLLQNYNLSDLVLIANVSDAKGNIVDTNHFYFVEPKDLELKKPQLTWSLNLKKKTIIIKNGDALAKNVQIMANPLVEFSKNYFDLGAGKSIRVNFTTSSPVQEIKKHLQLKSLYDTYEH